MRLRSLIVGIIVIVSSCGGPAETSDTSSTTIAPTTTAPTSSTTSATTDVPLDPTAGARDVADTYYPGLGNGGYDVISYDLDLVIDPEADTLGGIVTIVATATQDLSRFNLDFIGFEVERVTVDGTAAEVERSGAEMMITPSNPIARGTSFTAEVKYTGTPTPHRSQAIPEPLGWLEGRDGTQYVVSEPDGTRTWFPVNDHPSDKATYTFRLTVPADVVAIANGTLTETITDLGFSTWVWEMREPMASYLATVIVGDYTIVTDDSGPILIRNAYPTGYRPPPDVDRTGEMITYFSEVFGPYPFDVYGIAVVEDFTFALENQTLSLFGPDLVYEDVLVHELAHQWFGDAVTLADWSDIWLNEGFATYAEFLWAEHELGREFVEEQIRNIRDFINGDESLSPPGSPPVDELFNGGVYIRGAMVLHALRLEIGDDAFFSTLQTYFQRFDNRTVRTSDFIAVAEEVSGDDLDVLFDEWLFETLIPEFP